MTFELNLKTHLPFLNSPQIFKKSKFAGTNSDFELPNGIPVIEMNFASE